MTCREVYLVDASAYIYRAYHALTPLHNSHGLPTHAVYGFTTILRRILRERQPEYLAVAFDTRGPVFRHRIYPAYKANRPAMPDDLAAQIPYVKRIVQSYNILVLEHADQEADDMIASAVCRLAGGECRVVIVSGDKDLLQLVTGNVSFWDPMSDRTMSPETIRDKYGLTPAQLLDFFALTGDSSDNVPGVPGVGPKTAAKLLREYGSLEKLFASLDAMKASRVRDNLAAHRDEAFLSRDLIRLNTEAEVPGDRERYRLREPDSDALRSLLAELEFYSLLKSDVPPAKVDTQGFSLVQTREQLRELIDSLAGAQQIVIDTETSSLDPLTTDLVGLSICETRDQVWYIPCGHRDEGADLVPDQLTVGEITDALRPLLEKTGLPKIGHNIKFDLAVLALPHNGGINLTPPLYDTMVAA